MHAMAVVLLCIDTNSYLSGDSLFYFVIILNTSTIHEYTIVSHMSCTLEYCYGMVEYKILIDGLFDGKLNQYHLPTLQYPVTYQHHR